MSPAQAPVLRSCGGRRARPFGEEGKLHVGREGKASQGSETLSLSWAWFLRWPLFPTTLEKPDTLVPAFLARKGQNG